LRRKTSEPRIATEIAVVKAVNLDRTVKIDKILKQLSSQPRPLSLENSVDQAQMDLMEAESLKGAEAEKDVGKPVETVAPGKKEAVPTSGKGEAEVSSPVGEPSSLEVIQNRWGEFVERLESEKYRGLAKNSRPLELKGNLLVIGVPNSGTKFIFENSKDKSAIDRGIQEIFGEKLKVSFKILPGELSDEAGSPFGEEEEKTKKGKMKPADVRKMVEKDKNVKEILNAFGGEVVGFVPKEEKRKKKRS